jgi:DHA1 family tetracycline resistance protein-like MFS transporter
LVDPTEQGRLQGALASLTGIANLIGPTIFTQIFAASIAVPTDSHRWSGASFLLSAAIVIAAMVSVWRSTQSLDLELSNQHV